MTTIHVVTTERLVKGILDLLGRKWEIVRVSMDEPEHFTIETRQFGKGLGEPVWPDKVPDA